MDAKNIDEICEEYKAKPYKMHGDNLPFYFGEIMEQTDKWQTFPFKLDDRFIDFVRGLKELNNVALPKLDEKIHFSNSYTGFVELDTSKKFKYRNGIAPWAGFIDNGKFRYLQSESSIDDEIITKNSLFMKNGVSFEIFAVSTDDEAWNECKINGISREAHIDIPEDYRVSILQIPSLVRVMINTKYNAEHRDIIMNRIEPLIEVDFETKEYETVLAKLESDKNLFRNFDTMNEFMGKKYVCEHSKMFDVIGQKLRWNVTKRKDAMTFGEAVYMIRYFAANHK